MWSHLKDKGKIIQSSFTFSQQQQQIALVYVYGII